jgi:hypothetical protein
VDGGEIARMAQLAVDHEIRGFMYEIDDLKREVNQLRAELEIERRERRQADAVLDSVLLAVS